MPSSYADYIRDWDSLWQAVQDHADLLPGSEVHAEELADAAEHARDVKARQDYFAGARQKATQDLGDALYLGKEAAVKLRGLVKAKLGPKNELLNRFGIAPVRTRVRKTVEKPPPPPEQVKPEPEPAKPEQP